MFRIIKKIFIVLLTNLLNASNMHPEVIENARFNLLLLIYILTNKFRNYTIIHLRLS